MKRGKRRVMWQIEFQRLHKLRRFHDASNNVMNRRVRCWPLFMTCNSPLQMISEEWYLFFLLKATQRVLSNSVSQLRQSFGILLLQGAMYRSFVEADSPMLKGVRSQRHHFFAKSLGGRSTSRFNVSFQENAQQNLDDFRKKV